MGESDAIDQETLRLNSYQLKGKQSVRATFRLSNQMIDLLKIAATHLEVKQKSLIDELVQNRETLDRVVLDSQGAPQKETERRQKTFVLSRNSLESLDKISNKYDLSRDYLVELCIGRLVPFVDSEQEKHKQRRMLIKDAEHYLADGKKLLEQADKMLGRRDRFRAKLEKIVNYTERNVTEMRKFVKEKKTLMY
ncbi:MAG: hypothetical protein HKP41_06125 [Desulfobacterales bacterium]|nr:hypothetical protein [Deltaproteobacteria bacterium]MBT8361973.1 hypothetical protein [Deltaproteobacteria bacterium]NNK93911.1 hypothetical protein [Desulfobacterales bacterium]